jgi:hypothetical protein
MPELMGPLALAYHRGYEFYSDERTLPAIVLNGHKRDSIARCPNTSGHRAERRSDATLAFTGRPDRVGQRFCLYATSDIGQSVVSGQIIW